MGIEINGHDITTHFEHPGPGRHKADGVVCGKCGDHGLEATEECFPSKCIPQPNDISETKVAESSVGNVMIDDVPTVQDLANIVP